MMAALLQFLQKSFNRFYKIIILLLFVAVCFLLYQQSHKSSHLIAVLPLSNKGSDTESDFLGFALADQIIGRLIYHKDIRVRPSATIRRYDGQVNNPTEIGKDLGVSYILSGNYQRHENKI